MIFFVCIPKTLFFNCSVGMKTLCHIVKRLSQSCSFKIKPAGWSVSVLSYLFLKAFVDGASFIDEGRLFQLSQTRTLKKFFLKSLSPSFLTILRSPLVSRVPMPCLPSPAMVNQVSGETSYFPVKILKHSIMSPRTHLSSRVVRPTSFNFSSYVSPERPDTMRIALLCTCSNSSLS